MESTSSLGPDFPGESTHLATEPHIRLPTTDQGLRPATANDVHADEGLSYRDNGISPVSSTGPHSHCPNPMTTFDEGYDVPKNESNPPGMLEKLPVEIREMIWQYCMPTIATDTPMISTIQIRPAMWINGDTSRPRSLPKMCYISKTTRDETIGVFVRSSGFHLISHETIDTLRAFAASLEGGLNHIQELYFDTFGYYQIRDLPPWPHLKHEDLELAVDCHGLRTVRLTFARGELETVIKEEGALFWIHKPRAVKELVEYYHLRRLLDCKKLCLIQWDGLHCGMGSIDVLQDLADWVQKEFRLQNRNIECQVTWDW